MANETKSVLDILLAAEIPAPQTKKKKIRRLSKLAGEDVVVTLKELGFSRVAEITKVFKGELEMDVQILLAGMVDPDLKNDGLAAKYGAATPAELVKKMFTPGEISDLAREVQRLSGYLTVTLEDAEKK